MKDWGTRAGVHSHFSALSCAPNFLTPITLTEKECNDSYWMGKREINSQGCYREGMFFQTIQAYMYRAYIHVPISLALTPLLVLFT